MNGLKNLVCFHLYTSLSYAPYSALPSPKALSLSFLARGQSVYIAIFWAIITSPLEGMGNNHEYPSSVKRFCTDWEIAITMKVPVIVLNTAQWTAFLGENKADFKAYCLVDKKARILLYWCLWITLTWNRLNRLVNRVLLSWLYCMLKYVSDT